MDSVAKPITASNILYWTYDDTLVTFTKLSYATYADYADEYFRRYGEHLYIIEASIVRLTANDIANTAAQTKRTSLSLTEKQGQISR